jgi:hypothetical protein
VKNRFGIARYARRRRRAGGAAETQRGHVVRNSKWARGKTGINRIVMGRSWREQLKPWPMQTSRR